VLAVAVVDVVLGLAGVHPIGVLSGAWDTSAACWGARRRRRRRARALVGAAAARVVPAELVNLVSLAFVWAAFAAAEWGQSEAASWPPW
jgi:hypothetical protein